MTIAVAPSAPIRPATREHASSPNAFTALGLGAGASVVLSIGVFTTIFPLFVIGLLLATAGFVTSVVALVRSEPHLVAAGIGMTLALLPVELLGLGALASALGGW